MAKGPDDFADDWVDAKIAVSGYILSASVAYVSLCQVLGKLMGVDVPNSFMLVRIFGGFYSLLGVDIFVSRSWNFLSLGIWGNRRSTRLRKKFAYEAFNSSQKSFQKYNEISIDLTKGRSLLNSRLL